MLTKSSNGTPMLVLPTVSCGKLPQKVKTSEPNPDIVLVESACPEQAGTKRAVFPLWNSNYRVNWILEGQERLVSDSAFVTVLDGKCLVRKG